MAKADVVLKLFVQGQSTKSNQALEMVYRVCKMEFLQGYSLEVIDIHNNAEQAAQAGIRATPTLMRCSPEPVLRTTGQFSEARVRQGIGIQ